MSANNSSTADTAAGPFQPSVTSYLLGSLIILAAIPGWLGNFLVVLTIVARGFLHSTAPVIYKLIGSLAFSDFCQLSISIFYLGPSSCLQRWLIPDSWIALPGDIFLVNWYHMWFMMALIAINRYVAICRFAKYNVIFTHRRTTFCVIGSWILAVATWTHFLWMPCCRFYVSFIVYSYMWSPEAATQTNVGDIFVEWPGNAGTTIFIVICYTFILISIRKSRKRVAAHGGPARSKSRAAMTQEESRKAQEVRLTIQFLVIALVYFLVWAMFRICPVIIGMSSLETYVIVALLVIANSSVNPIIYMVYNEALRKEFLILMGKKPSVPAANINGSKRRTTEPGQQAMGLVSQSQNTRRAPTQVNAPGHVVVDTV